MGRGVGAVGVLLAIVAAGCGPEAPRVGEGTTSAGESSEAGDSSGSGAASESSESSGGSTGSGMRCEIDCEVFRGACEALGTEDCAVAVTCASDPCSACGQAIGACALAGVACPAVDAACAGLRSSCDCDECGPVGEQTPDERLAICYEFPWPLGDSCEAPNIGQCFAALGQAGCAATTCEYRDCVAAVAGDPCGLAPKVCATVLACSE